MANYRVSTNANNNSSETTQDKTKNGSAKADDDNSVQFFIY
jgi:hypothetical protein